MSDLLNIGKLSIPKITVGRENVSEISLGRIKLWPNEVPILTEVTIGTQTWMAVNLDIDDGGGGIYAYDNDEGNAAIYGRLYTWDAAMRVTASIEGWRLPSKEDFEILEITVGGSATAGDKLKEVGTAHWIYDSGETTDEYNFTALPAGQYQEGSGYANIGTVLSIWTTYYIPTDLHDTFRLDPGASSSYVNYPSTITALSVRLIKEIS